MPIYEYECNKCGKKFDHLVFLSRGDAGVKCPACACDDVHRMISKFATSKGEGGASYDSSCGTQSFG